MSTLMSTLREMYSNQNKKPLNPSNTIKKGDIILVADTDMAKHRWPLGVVEQLLKGMTIILERQS